MIATSVSKKFKMMNGAFDFFTIKRTSFMILIVGYLLLSVESYNSKMVEDRYCSRQLTPATVVMRNAFGDPSKNVTIEIKRNSVITNDRTYAAGERLTIALIGDATLSGSQQVLEIIGATFDSSLSDVMGCSGSRIYLTGGDVSTVIMPITSIPVTIQGSWSKAYGAAKITSIITLTPVTAAPSLNPTTTPTAAIPSTFSPTTTPTILITSESPTTSPTTTPTSIPNEVPIELSSTSPTVIPSLAPTTTSLSCYVNQGPNLVAISGPIDFEGMNPALFQCAKYCLECTNDNEDCTNNGWEVGSFHAYYSALIINAQSISFFNTTFKSFSTCIGDNCNIPNLSCDKYSNLNSPTSKPTISTMKPTSYPSTSDFIWILGWRGKSCDVICSTATGKSSNPYRCTDKVEWPRNVPALQAIIFNNLHIFQNRGLYYPTKGVIASSNPRMEPYYPACTVDSKGKGLCKYSSKTKGICNRIPPADILRLCPCDKS